MGMFSEAADHIINGLLQENYLNETRFAQAYARGKFRTKKWGKSRILRELKMRDISEFNLKLALKEIPEDEYIATFHTLVEKRIEQVSSEKNIFKKKKKIADYLIYRGWESHLIWDRLGELKT